MLMFRGPLVALVLCGWLLPVRLWSDDIVPKVVVENVSNPLGLAVQPETGHVFVAEGGEGRVVRIIDGQLQPVVIGLPQVEIQQRTVGPFKPMGLEFIDRRTLVLSVSDIPHLGAAICIAQLPEEVGAEPLDFDALLRIVPLTKAGDSSGPNYFFGVTASKSAIYVTQNDNEGNGWILQADIKNLKDMSQAESFGQLKRLIATRDTVKVGSPAGITLSARGEIVVGHLGATDPSRDSHLSFYRSTDGRLLLNLETGLFDIVAVQYGVPRTPSHKAYLYALDLAVNSPEFGGLYRLDAEFRSGKQAIRAVKIATLERPAAMALGNDGSMYVAILGPADGDGSTGKVWQFEPGL